MADAEAKERLLGLLGYVKDMSAPSESEPCKDLASAPIVVHEALLRDVAGAGAVEFEGPCGAWLRVRRPEATGASRQSAAGKRGAAARSLYAELFGARQEALREGRGAALTLGVGLLRWPAAGVEHPLVLIVPELETCGRDYGLLGRRREAPSPFDRTRGGAAAPRAHLLGPDGVLVDGPHAAPVPSKPAAAPAPDRPTVHNCAVLFCRESGADRAGARDAEALSAALRRRTAPLPAALRRLAGDFSAPPAPAPAGVAGLWRAAAKWWRGPAAAAAAPVYFGLPSNDAQASVVATLEAKGCAVLVGPPGTGKSQTIANVICHYLALGRRVLVTSKGEPATEVLRKKLPDGIRELCVSLGSGDGGSFRRLEAAVEYLADTVAAAPCAAPERELRAAADRARQRHDAARAELDAFDAEDAARARKYFGRSDLAADLGCHADHLRLLGLSDGSSARHAAEAVARVGEAPFLADVDPPRGARLAERLDVGAARDAAQRLRERNDVAALVRRGDLPRVDAAEAAALADALAAARKQVEALEALDGRRWLLRLLRRADDDRAAADVKTAAWLAGQLAARGRAAAETEVPPVLLRMVSAAKLDAPLAAPADDDDDAAVAAAVVGANDFFEEVRWRALRPDRRPFLAGLVRARPTATLAAELDEITVFGRRPKTPNEWELCIAFSNAQFYHDRLLPRRLPPRSQRLTPALVDVKVPGGKKKGKTNEAEAAAVVAYLAAQLAPGGELATRGASLARHDVVVGDPASLQGDERDVVLLSLVASPKEAPAQDVPNADDLKHRTLAFFQRAAAARPPRAAPRRSPPDAARDDAPGAVLRFLEASGYRCDDHCSIAASTAVLEDALGEDRRICVCGPKAKKPKSAPKAAAAKPKKAAKKRRASDDDSDGEWDGD
ncbi:hypothetical protein JL720_13630 [Aureococcus anophagefferens]|nr:hypothetical protein JL720_13630 [Aureococcus anophagefferens]